jgi:hypothetical protein
MAKWLRSRLSRSVQQRLVEHFVAVTPARVAAVSCIAWTKLRERLLRTIWTCHSLGQESRNCGLH